jgi:hypothetical protein
MIKHDCMWSLSPTVARQAFSMTALAWVESPLDSSHLFIIPRVMQRDFGLVNRHIRYLGQFDPKEIPFESHPCHVPLLLFYHRTLTNPSPQGKEVFPSYTSLGYPAGFLHVRVVIVARGFQPVFVACSWLPGLCSMASGTHLAMSCTMKTALVWGGSLPVPLP